MSDMIEGVLTVIIFLASPFAIILLGFLLSALFLKWINFLERVFKI